MEYEILKIHADIWLYILELTSKMEIKTVNMKCKTWGHKKALYLVKIELNH